MDLTKLLNIEYPIFQGGMANISTGKFAALVSNAGALGIIGSGGMTTEELERQIDEAKELTDKPFGVNIMLLNPEADKQAELICKKGIKVVTTGAGNPHAFMDMWKENGIKVFPVVSNKSLAMRMEKLGADGVVAEGTEAGGHIGETTTFVLIPEVAGAVNIPVIAAGGIATGKQMYAAEILGASGFQMGTAFLASLECPIHENYKASVVKAKSNNITVTGRIKGSPVRLIKNKMVREYIRREEEGADMMELEKFTLGSLRKAVLDGNTQEGSLMAGQCASLIEDVKPIKEILDTVYDEYLALKERK